MQLNTKHFGEIEIDEKGIIDFSEGIPGFENEKKFILLANPQEDSPFQWLQAVNNANLAFVVIEPKLIRPDYEVDIDDAEVAKLEIKDTKNVIIYTIVVVPEDVSKITTNLKAPVLINTENMRGKQVILDRGGYKTKHFILEELQKNGG